MNFDENNENDNSQNSKVSPEENNSLAVVDNQSAAENENNSDYRPKSNKFIRRNVINSKASNPYEKIKNIINRNSKKVADENIDENAETGNVDDTNKQLASAAKKQMVSQAKKQVSSATVKEVTAAGIKAVVGFVASNPIVLAIILGLLLLIIIFMFFFAFDYGTNEVEGYFDITCDFNITAVSCSNGRTVDIKDYVIGKVYSETQKRKFSEEQIKALMIIVKTNALAIGNYNSEGDKIISLNDCNIVNEDNVEDKSTYEDLLDYYDDIRNYLFVSVSYTDDITDLGSADILEYNDDILDRLSNIIRSDYKEILEELYPNTEGGDSETVTTANNNPSIFVGDSRTVGMKNSVSELNDNNTVAEGSKGYDWFVNTAIDSINSKVSGNNAYNIISWMGVNNLASNGSTWAQTYFDKYKDLAQTSWKQHTIYVVKVGPVVDEKTYYVDNNEIDAFNSKIKELITNANISNLKYLDINYSISSYDAEGLHYGTSDYQKIYDDIKNEVSSTKTISKNKALYNNADYCSYYNYKQGCEAGWWYPIGEKGNFEKGAILRGDPELVDTGPDNFGWRNDPINGGRAYHSASDLWANLGMNVIATRSGTVVVAVDGHRDNAGLNDGEGCGNYIKIDHGDGFTSLYCHLKQGSVSKYVTVGMSVSQGQIIALSGNSGRTTGPHLHFGISEGGTVRNPFDFISTEMPRPKTNNCKNYEADTAGVCHALKDLGFSDNAVAGLMANIISEGGFDPTTVVPNDNGGPSYGMIGWHDASDCSTVDVCEVSTKLPGLTCNGSNLKCFCRQNGMEWDTVACQTAFLKKYIDDHANTPGFDAAKEIYGDYSAYDIAVQFSFKLERCSQCFTYSGKHIVPGVPGPACYIRGSRANEFLPFVKNGCKD